MANRIGRNETTVETTTVETKLEKVTNRTDDRANVRMASDNITDMLDDQALRNFEINLELNRYRSELRHALEKLDEHSYCPGDVDIHCDKPKCRPEYKEDKKPRVAEEPQHTCRYPGSKASNFLKKNKMLILVAILWVVLIILAVGWSPSGDTFDAIQNGWVELIVNFFKMALFAVAGVATYCLIKKENE